MQPYKVLVSIEVLHLKRPSRQQRDQILSFLESLAEHPSKPDDYEERDEVGRPIQITIVGDYALTYWADHAVKEVKVTRIETADQE